MKKNYLFLVVLGLLAASNLFSQSLWEDNFESYPLGNFLDGNGWVREDGQDDWAQIVELDSIHGKSLQLFAPDTNLLGMFVTHNNNWANRTQGNNVFETNFDFYTGNAQSEGLGQVVIANSNFYEIVSIGMLSGGNSLFIYADGLDTSLVENALPDTWYNITITYDKLSGKVIAQVDGGPKISGSGAADLDPEIFDFTALLASNVGTDNIKVSATKSSILNLPKVHQSGSTIAYPNPVHDVLNIRTDKNVAHITIYDIAGRVAGEFSTQTELDFSSFTSGIFAVNILFEDGTQEVHKVIKK